MAMADYYEHKMSSLYLQKWLSCDITHVENKHFSSFRDFSVISLI